MKWPNCVSLASVKVVTAREADIPSWLEIEVEPLFEHMPDFERTLQKNIARGTAYCIRNRSGQVRGGHAAAYAVALRDRVACRASLGA